MPSTAALPPASPPPAPARAWRRRLAWGLALVAAWTLSLGVALPRWARQQVQAQAQEALGTPVTLGALALNPWTLTLTLESLRVGPAQAPWLRLETLRAQASLQSLWRGAPVLRQLRLTRPEVNLERLDARTFNISPALDRLAARPSDPKAPPTRFAVYNIEVVDGSVRLKDRVLNAEHAITGLFVGVPFISNLPSQVRVTVQPVLRASVDGSALDIRGETLPFEAGHRSRLEVNLKAVNLAQWMAGVAPLLPADLRPDLRSGLLDAALSVTFEERAAPQVSQLEIGGGLTVKALDLAWPSGGVSGSWKTLSVAGLALRPLERQADVADVTLDGLAVTARPAAGKSPNPAPAVAPQPEAAWRWSVGRLKVTTGRLAWLDSRGTPWPAVAQATVSAQKLSAHADAPAGSFHLILRDERSGEVSAQGTVQLAQGRSDIDLAVKGWDLSPWAQAAQSRLATPLLMRLDRGSAELALHAAVQWQGERPGVDLTRTSLGLRDVQLRSAAPRDDRLAFQALDLLGVQARLALPGGPADRAQTALPAPSLSADSLTLERLDARWLRDAQGAWLAAPAGTSGRAVAAATPPPKSQAAADTPSLALGTFACRQCQVALTDATVSPSAAWRVSQMDLRVQNLSNRPQQALKVSLNTRVQDSGKVGFEGEVKPEPLAVKGQVALQGVNLAALQPYLAPLLNVTLASANAQAKGSVLVQTAADSSLSAHYQGALGLSEFRLVDPVNDADLLTFKGLQLSQSNLAWSSAGAVSADLGRIALNDFYSRVIINPNGRINLADIRRQQGQAEAASLTTPQASPPVAGSAPAAAGEPGAVTAIASAASPAPKVRWQSIELRRGRIDFTDNFIRPNYSARLTQVKGDISAVASDSVEPAQVSITGAVDDAAPLRISGRFNPLGPRLFTDIEGSAKGIELTRLTPYAARYAGYPIDKGSLSVTVSYKIEEGKLQANNAIYLDQLTFGAKSDSPDATSLPVRLAVSLLQDRNGVIDINLPISGSLDDPSFSVGGLIWKVLGNLIAKAVTAPFSLLSGGADELGFVAFEAGSDALTAQARQGLDTLASKLQDRPSLRLEATGHSDPEQDGPGLQQRHVERLMRQAKAKRTGQPLDESWVFEGAERQAWLKAAYDAATDLPKPRNLVGLAKGLPPAEMEALLRASADTREATLRDLANRRADRVKAHLTALLPAERVLLTASRLGREGLPQDTGPSTRVQFAIK